MKTYSSPLRWALTAAMMVLATVSVHSQNNGPVNAVSLDGTNGYVSVPSGVWFSGDFTVEGWVFARSYNDWERLIDFSDGPNNYNVYLSLSFGGNGFPTMGSFLGNNGTPTFSATSQLPTNQWVHLAATLSGTTGTIYLNGVASGSGTLNVPPNVVRTNNYIGRSAYPSDSYANAEFDEIRIWNVARTPSQIQADMHRSLAGTETGLIGYWRFDEGTGTTTADISGNGQTATLMGGASWTNSTAPITAGPGSGLDFNGTNCQLVTIPHQAALDAFPITVMTWVNLPTNQPLGGGLVNKYVSSSLNGWQIAQGGQVYAWYYRNGSNFVGLAAAGAINDGLWHHVAYVVDASGGRIYLDGELQQSVAWTGTPGACTTTQPLEFGIYPGDSCLLGQIDEVSIWNAALTTNQIQTNMHKSLLGTEPNLVAYYRFDEGAGTTTVDATGNGNNGTLQNGATWVPSGAPVGAPQVATFAAASVPGVAPTLNSTVNAEGQDTGAWFQWGSTAAYGNDSTTNSIGPAFTASTNSAVLTGLAAGTYHFQVVGTNSGGTNFGEDMTFTFVTTPMIAGEAATSVYATTATLNATVNPDEAAAAWYFEYGPTTNYGFFTATNIVPTGSSPVAVSSVVTGLTPGIPYYFQLVTMNSVGSNESGPFQFTTGNVLVVTTNADDGGSGTLRTMVANAVSSDDITFDPSLSGATILLTNGEILLTNSIAIDASTLSGGLQLDGNGSNTIFEVTNDAVVVLDSLTITNGFSTSDGGGVFNTGGALTLNQCTLSGNFATNSAGGGIYSVFGTLTLNQCTMSGNSAAGGGGGGAIAAYFTTLALNECTLSGNEATNCDGGGILVVLSTLALNQCTLFGNTADNGAGGGIYNEYQADITNSIVAGNSADNGGADIYVDSASLNYGGTNIVESVSNSSGTITGTAPVDADPDLNPLSNNGGPTQTMLPMPSSPAIDADGDFATNFFATDERGYPRLSGPHVDLGAVEVQQAAATTLAATAITGTNAIGNGTITPNDLQTAWYFQYGTDTNYSNGTGMNSLAPGFSPVAVSNTMNNLAPATTYHYQTVAYDGVSDKFGVDATFTTPDTAPSAQTETPTVFATTAILMANIDPDGLATEYYFEYGATTNYGFFSPTNTLPAGNSIVTVTYETANLAPGSDFYYQVVTSNSLGTNDGAQTGFTTGNVLVVTTNADDGGPGTLRTVVQNAGVNDTITFTNTLSGATILLTNGEIELTNYLAIDGSALASGIMIDGNANSRIFNINSGYTLFLTSLTITNGLANGVSGGGMLNNGELIANNCIVSGNNNTNDSGGGIYNNSEMTLNNCSISGNYATYGAGGFQNNGTATLNQCNISTNLAWSGEGGAFYSLGTMTLNQCTIFGNTANDGGVTFNIGSLTFNQCILAGNSAEDSGAIHNDNVVTLNQCTLSGNSATNGIGGGINNQYEITLDECTLSGNSANSGAGIYNNGTVTMDQSTLSRNSATNGDGGGIYNASSAAASITNSIVAGNQSDLGSADIFNSSGSQLTYSGSNIVDIVVSNGGTIFGTMPLTNAPDLAALGNYGGPTQTMPPLPGSPAIASCFNGTNFTTDQRGFPRPTNAVSDIGAVQLQTPFLLVTSDNDSGAGSLRQTLDGVDASSTITFASNLSGMVIQLTSGPIPLTNNVTIDGSALGNSIVFDGHTNSRIFQVSSNCTVALNSLTIANGLVNGHDGGGIFNAGTTTLNECTVSGNASVSGGGGGVFNTSIMTLNQCTLSANLASNSSGGGILNSGALTLNQCTLSENSADPPVGGGGGIFNSGTLTVNQSTLSGNSASNSDGGGILNDGAMSMTNSIVSGNSAVSGAGADIYNSSLLTYGGSNIVGVIFSVSDTITGTAPITAAANLQPLGNYGGRTLTMLPMANSPAIDAGSDSVTNVFAADQRGFPRLSGLHVDIGAVEVQEATAATLAASNLAATNVAGSGSVTPNDLETIWYFEYGTNTSYGSFSSTNILAPGFSPVSVSNLLGGLAPATTYHYQLFANDGLSTTAGGDVSFTTLDASPSTVTGLATGVAATNATLNAAINPDGAATGYYFRYGPTTNYGFFSSTNLLAAGNTAANASAAITGLTPNAAYYYQAVATNSLGTNAGLQAAFTTAALLPVAVTEPATGIAAGTATLNASINPGYTSAAWYFRYGPTANYGYFTATNTLIAGSSAVAVSNVVTGLLPGTNYYYEVVATNSAGTGAGLQASLLTAAIAPVATTKPATNIGPTFAALNASINPGGAATAWFFQYGPTTNYGLFTATNTMPAGSSAVNVGDLLTNLTPAMVYHYQIVAMNSAGSNAGVDLTFTNLKTPIVIIDSEIVVAIISPANKLSTTNSSIAVKGTIKGGGTNPQLQVTVNSNTPEFATNGATTHGTIAWSYTTPLAPGRNIITAQTIDTNGTEVLAAPAIVTVFYVTNLPVSSDKSTVALTVSPAGSGHITGETVTAMLEINKVYTVKATSASGWIFTNWTVGTNTSSVLGSDATLSFTMASGLALQANFVTNPFPAVAGAYDGLFSPVTGVNEESSGFFSANLTAGSGSYTAKLMLDGGSYSFSDSFDLSGNSEVTVGRTGKPPVEVILHLNLPVPDDQMTGYVVNFASNGWTSTLQANRAVFGKSNSATDYAGKYTLIIPPGSGAPANSPGGYSYGTLANSSGGIATISGSLADKTAISQSVAISKDGNIPLYVSLYSTKGSLQGWLTLTNETTNQTSPAPAIVGANLAWFKPGGAGFTSTNLSALGSLYTGDFTLDSGTLTVGSGTAAPQIFTNVKVAGNKLLSSNSVVLGTITPATGTMTLTLKATDTTPKITAKGVVLQYTVGTNAAGWFPGTDESGYFLLQP